MITFKIFFILRRWGGAAFLRFHHVHLKQNKNKTNTGRDVNLNVRFVLWLSLVISGLWLCNVSPVWLTALSVAKLFVSLPLKGQRRSNPNKKKKQNAIIFPKQTTFPVRFWKLPLMFFHGVRDSLSPRYWTAQPFFRITLSSLLIILSTLPETLFICGMFQTGGFERSTTFRVFCWPCLHLFWNVRQPLNSEFAHSEPLSGWGQITRNIWHIWKETNWGTRTLLLLLLKRVARLRFGLFSPCLQFLYACKVFFQSASESTGITLSFIKIYRHIESLKKKILHRLA